MSGRNRSTVMSAVFLHVLRAVLHARLLRTGVSGCAGQLARSDGLHCASQIWRQSNLTAARKSGCNPLPKARG